MGKLARKNLVLDPERVRELARRRGTSESEAVRQVIDFALAAEEIVEAFDELAARGGVDDVFGKLPVDRADREHDLTEREAS
ncbi:MAG: ribbon-helix-helix protein, CopG family [Chloroflexi bacterium]|nr:ribbon-helix-helix protein, CopG family [Chloroflexota bacterium]